MRIVYLIIFALTVVSCGMGNPMAMHMPTPNVEATPAVVQNGITIRDPWARQGTKGDNSAAYLVINNTNTTEDTIVRVTSDIAASVELHTVVTDNGMMQMVPVEGGIPVPASGTQFLKPGSYHIMLIGLSKDLKTGDTFTLVVTFAQAGPIPVTVEVR